MFHCKKSLIGGGSWCHLVRMKIMRRSLGLTSVPRKSALKESSSSSDIDTKPNGVGSETPHFNPCNIQMISDKLYNQVFIDEWRQKTFDKETVAKLETHLKAHNLWGQQKNMKALRPVELDLPQLEGIDIDHHFRNIALQQTFPYKALMDDLIKTGIPPAPKEWVFKEGWHQYSRDGTQRPVLYPDEDAYIFDVEVCMSNGKVPTLACAVSTKAWYSWCSESLISGQARDPLHKVTLNELIPFETGPGECRPASGEWKEKLIIGHNVSYDRARIKEQYFLEKTKMRFMDTMSMHTSVSGITSFQRALKMTMQSRSKRDLPLSRSIEENLHSSFEWNELSSLNNLADVYKLYSGGEELKKDQRNVFVKGTLLDVQLNFNDLMSYCSRDVEATHTVFQKLLPKFFKRFPHPVTLCGTLEMGTTFLPVNSNWEKYIKSSENAFENLQKEVKSILILKANEALRLLENEKYKHDPWLWDLDWKVSKPRRKPTDVGSTTDPQYPAWYKKLLYKPHDKDYEPGPAKISSSMQVVPKLLRLTWFGFPLHYSKTGKWGFLVKKIPNEEKYTKYPEDFQIFDDSDCSEEKSSDECEKKETPTFPYEEWEKLWSRSKTNLIEKFGKSGTHLAVFKNEMKNSSEETAQDLAAFVKGLQIISGLGLVSKTSRKSRGEQEKPTENHSPHPNCEFIPLPHKNGANNRVGNPLSKDFLSKIEEGTLSCENGKDIANQVVRISKMVSYWRNNRDRILSQLTVWDSEKSASDEQESSHSGTADDKCIGAILPQVVVAGTLTRRAVEPTWMTASNAYVDRVGSELKGMIQAPSGYHFVGADVDSQELWIASIIGDTHFARIHGCTALGWMTLQGNKGDGTDMHSKTATAIGIERDQAKILNYARIYGAGVTFAERLLLQFNRDMSSTEAKNKAKSMYRMTKGERKYMLNEEGLQLLLATDFEEFKKRNCGPFAKSDLIHIMSFHHFPYSDYMTLVDKLVWDDGTESHMFNRLEEIAQEKCPQTPILGCSISRSLVPSVVHNDYMTSRVNWVVQSSAVDYLHLMLTCMGWLMKKYDINGRFSLSVHDEVRYLVNSEDRYRAALALQITNLLTRSFCSYKLEMFDLPQSVGFFSCVDIDKVLRKEVTHDCVTPSNPQGLAKGYGIPEGEALDIYATLKKTGTSIAIRNTESATVKEKENQKSCL